MSLLEGEIVRSFEGIFEGDLPRGYFVDHTGFELSIPLPVLSGSPGLSEATSRSNPCGDGQNRPARASCSVIASLRDELTVPDDLGDDGVINHAGRPRQFSHAIFSRPDCAGLFL